MRFVRAAALLCALVSSHAFAQSSPGFTYGQVPTAGQWNQYFSSKQDTLGYVPVNRGGDTMTGKLNFMPATAAAASYNIGITNTVPTSPKDGDVWATSAGLFARINGATYDILSNNTVMSGSSVFANPTGGTATGQAVPIDGSLRFYGGYFGVALPSTFYIGGAFSTTATTNQFLTGLGTDGIFTKAQPAVGDLSGLGTGVATALGNAVNSAGGLPTLDGDGHLSSNLTYYQSALTGAQSNSLTSILDNIVIATNYMGWADVGDVTSYAGSLNLASTVNQIISNNAGKTIVFPAGKWRFASHLSCPAGTTIQGVGWGELTATTPSEPNVGTVFYQDYLAAADTKGIEATGPHCTVANLEIRQPQPTPGVGWTPNENPWAIYSNPAAYSEAGGHRLTVRNVMLRNVTYGIFTDRARGGEFTDIYGQPFKVGIKVTGDGDTSTWRNIQLGWTYWTGNTDVLAYQFNNMDGITLGRVDTPMMSDIFIWGAHRGFRTYYDTSHSDAAYDGVATGVKIANIDLDNCNTCMAVEDNPEIYISNFRSTPNTATTGQCISSYGVYNPGANYGNLRLTINGGACVSPGAPALALAYAPSGTPVYPQYIKLTGFHITQPATGSWSSGSPAIATPSAQATVLAWDITVDNVTDGATILGGNGTLVWQHGPQSFNGNVTAYNFTALGSAPAYLLVNTSAGADLKRWSSYNDASGTWHLLATDDTGSAGTDAITITRSGYTPTLITLNAFTASPGATILDGGGASYQGDGTDGCHYTYVGGDGHIACVQAGVGWLPLQIDGLAVAFGENSAAQTTTFNGAAVEMKIPVTYYKQSAAPASAPGAGKAFLFVVAGTTAGTCKLQMMAGTSTTPVTIVDDVGGGC